MSCIKKIVLFAIFLLFSAGMQEVIAQTDYFKDTVWTKKTDQIEGFWMVKFSDNDSIIAAHGYNDVLFFDAFRGNEIKRLSGNKELFFINSDLNFIKLNENRTKIDIFNTKSFLLSDSLQNDGSLIGAMNISNDKNLFIATINNGTGVRIWDIKTKQILKTKTFDTDNDPNLLSTNRIKIFFNCTNSEFILTIEKQYKGSDNNTYLKTYHAMFNTSTFDSVGVINTAFYRLSNNCSKIAYLTANPTYGVEVYDFNTKELFWKLPINGLSLTGIEFSPDDKYLVTAGGPPANIMKIWDMSKGEQIYDYKGSSFMNIDISHDGKYIIWTSGRWIEKYFARWQGTTVPRDIGNTAIIYPNPSTGIAVIEFENITSELTSISLYNLSGLLIKILYDGLIENGNQKININVSDLANSTYYIKVNNSQLSLFYKLIINK